MDLTKIKNKSDNFYSQALFFIGWIVIVLCVVGSIVLGNTYADYYEDFNFALFLVGIITTAMSGFLILGLAEVISIMNDNRRLLATLTQNNESAQGSGKSVAKSIAEELPEL